MLKPVTILYIRYGIAAIILFSVLFVVFNLVFKKYFVVDKRLTQIKKSSLRFDDLIAPQTMAAKTDAFFESSTFFNLPIIGPHYKKKIELLKANNLNMKPKEYVLLSLAIPFFLFIISFFFFTNIFISFGVALAGSMTPTLYMVYLRNKRQLKIDQQLPDFLSVLSNGLRAGLSINQSMAISIGEMTDPLKWEFQKITQDVSLGRSLDKSLEEMAVRVNNENLTMFVTAVIIQRQIGGNLSEILDLIAQTIREKIMMRRKIKTLMAQNKMSAFIIGFLPAALAIIISVLSPGYLKPLYTDPLGQIAIGVALVMMAIGVALLKKITDLEV